MKSNEIIVYKADGMGMCPDEYCATVAGKRITYNELSKIKFFCNSTWPNLKFKFIVK